jgi:nucleotide-binding universal stress UspA family protein
MKVVVGYLRSPEGQAAMHRAVEEARQRRGEVAIVGYVDMPHDAEGTQGPHDRDAVRRTLEEYAGELRETGVDVSVHVPLGPESPSEAILNVAQTEQADLIVIGLRRRTRVGKLVLGSNSQDVLLGAHVPVLAVKAQEEGP